MGGFGSKGGLRRFTPVDQGDLSGRINVSSFFTRKRLEGDSQELQFSFKEEFIQKIIQPCCEEERESPEKSAEENYDSVE